MRLKRALALMFACWIACASAPGSAQTSAAASGPTSAAADPAYARAIASALEEFERGNWVEARVYFQQAHVLRPSARTLRGLGAACYESRSYVEAIDYLERALASAVQPLTPAMRTAAKRLLEQARQFVMHVKIELEPAHAELRVDGSPATLSGDGLILDPGEHELWAFAPGFEALHRRITATGGNEALVRMALSVAPELAAAPALRPIERAAEPAEPMRPAASLGPWLLIGGSAALAAAGGVLLSLGLSDKAAVESVQDGASWKETEAANGRAVPFQTAGGVMLGLGVAGFAAGVIWQLSPREEHRVSLRAGPSRLALNASF